VTESIPRPNRPRIPLRGRPTPLAVAAWAAAILVAGVVLFAQIWTEVVWFRQLEFEHVWRTEWITRAGLFVGAGVVAAAAVWGSLAIARRARPRVNAQRRTPVDQYREQLQGFVRIGTVIVSAVVGLAFASALSSQWQTILAWWHAEPFGRPDPHFGFDASFFVFGLPAYSVFLNFLLWLLLIASALALFVHLLYGGITTGGRTFVATGVARIQLATMGAMVMIVIAVRAWLARYELVFRTGDTFDGARYTDINATLPALGILAGVALIVALTFIAMLFRSDWRIPIAGVVLMVLSYVAVGGIYPWVVQRFQVAPNEQELEAPFIEYNIQETLFAYGLEDVEYTSYDAETQVLPGALRADAQTTASIRLLDPSIVSPAFKQLQQNKQYYDFPGTLSVDRYTIDGETRDTVIAVRELNLDGLSAENRNWVNDHTVFTHGFGVVAAFGNQTNEDGQPTFYEGGIPSVGELGDYEPRIYFGTSLPDYSIVGAPEGSEPWELDFPDDTSPSGQVNTTYAGDGGPRIGNIFDKLFFGIRFGSEQMLFSDRVTTSSQVLYYRDPVERVRKVAPFLEIVESTPYPAVVDGRVLWVVDGYTSTETFPYSARLYYGVNDFDVYAMSYMRNSVKATVDAYDGSVTLYAWDEEDPILRTWANVYPESFTPVSEISSELMSHLRYPETLFLAQRSLLARYHVTDAPSFYSGQDFWRTPNDPTAGGSQEQPPYYLTLQMPGEDTPVFSLTSTFIPGGNSDRNVLTGFVAVNSEPGNVAGVPDEDYGQLRVLVLPRDSTVPGPGQVQNAFNADPEAQNVLNLLRQGETDVQNGNLLTLPVGDGLLYVQPVYVQASQGTQFPLLQKVFVAFGDTVGFADTLDEALDQVFGSTSFGDPEPTQGEGSGTDPSGEDGVAAARLALQEALAEARRALEEGQSALAEGDFAAYGEAQDRLELALTAALAAEAALENATESAQAGVVAEESVPSTEPSPSSAP